MGISEKWEVVLSVIANLCDHHDESLGLFPQAQGSNL